MRYEIEQTEVAPFNGIDKHKKRRRLVRRYDGKIIVIWEHDDPEGED